MHVIADTDAAGNVLRSYTWGPGIDNLLAMTVYGGTATNTFQAISDHLGTVHALVTPSGTVAERYEYDAWGNVLGVFDGNGGSLPSSVLGLRYLFQGREYSWAIHAAWDGAGLYYFRARWYNPQTGRWLSNDPIGISGGLNQYAFCANNPVMFLDPEGLDLMIVRAVSESTRRHQKVVVGSYALSYGPVTGTSLWGKLWGSSKMPEKGGVGDGNVYNNSQAEVTKVLERVETTPEEDEYLKKEMEKEEENRGNYGIVGTDCREYCADLFNRMKALLEKQRAECQVQ